MSDALDRQQFDQLVHDAYESFGPDEEARGRVLLSLQEAKASKGAQGRRGVRPWLVALPVAACLALAAVLIQTNDIAPVRETTMVSDETVDNETVADEEVAYESASEPSEKTVVEEADEVVTLADGSSFVVGDVLEGEPAYESVEEAQVDGRPCVVADRAFVRFEGEDTWYELYPMP